MFEYPDAWIRRVACLYTLIRLWLISGITQIRLNSGKSRWNISLKCRKFSFQIILEPVLNVNIHVHEGVENDVLFEHDEKRINLNNKSSHELAIWTFQNWTLWRSCSASNAQGLARHSMASFSTISARSGAKLCINTVYSCMHETLNFVESSQTCLHGKSNALWTMFNDQSSKFKITY